MRANPSVEARPNSWPLGRPAGEAYHPSGRAKRLAVGPASPRRFGSAEPIGGVSTRKAATSWMG